MKVRLRQNGFTIVELLIVIVVIGILAAITIVAYSTIRQRAQNSERKSEIAMVVKAVELYNVDNGKYPTAAAGTPGAPLTCLSSIGWNCWGAGTNTNALVPSQYASKMPQDPQYLDDRGCDYPNPYTSRMYGYTTNAAGNGYMIGAYIPGMTASETYYNDGSTNLGCMNFANYLIRKNM